MAKETLADAQKRALDLQYQLDDATKRAEKLTVDLDTANELGRQAIERATDAEKRAAAAEAEVVGLAKSLRAYKGSATKLRAQAEVLKCKLSPESRKVGAMKASRDEQEAADRREALAAAFAMGPVEIVFSDGKREIREIAPLMCTADAFLQTPHHRELDSDPVIEVVGERAKVDLAGFCLLNEVGEQVAYCELPTKLEIGRGQHMRMPKGSIRF